MAVWDATQAELARLGAAESVEGQVALRLAEQLDAPRNGMAVSGDANVLLRTISEIRERSVKKADPIDELNARRAARGAVPEAV
jgi:hypothetical protein